VLHCPAKINLTLEVLDLLEGGYHQLDSVFCSLDLADELSWRESDSVSLKVSGDLMGMAISEGEDNLVLRALRALEAACGRSLPVAIELVKRIPAGGGLGGGSVDAGALLWGLNAHFGLGFSVAQLQQIGATLGADVAFGVVGGCARGEGRGDQLTALPAPPSRPLWLVIPPFPCPTGAVYRAWDEERFRPARGATEAYLQGQWVLGNDLQPAACRVAPALQDIFHALEPLGPVLLCGSGSTISLWSEVSQNELNQVLAPFDCKTVAARLQGVARS
jgi:4-diphosphocytidyl-2-C-methyl-D-erythritol kinase